MNNHHPSDEELLHFAGGELDETRFEQIAEHLEACASCGEVLRKTGVFPKLGDCHLSLREGCFEATHRSAERTATMISEGPGSIIGPYKLLQKLGEGGMGVVYMAEQERPVRRIVALKIIKPGMDSRQVIARFEAERQALAMMDHHHIAKVLDAGTTDTGRPYFAMELVKGVPITQYCDHNKLTPRERLEMFIPVCQAIQHAHQKGVIHRDIKPTNVLVTLYDGKPVPKVIDFGIAKATQQKLTERTMFTGIGQILGTLEYMSPEQAEMNQLDIDTRSDVYSLGVMLYELLTGSTPIGKGKLRNVGLEEMLRTIRETEPPKPSTRLSESGEALPSISSVRKTEPTKLSKLVRGDLDWIVMKALEKDRTRRYETANGLAMDVERFLKDEAVEACPPSAQDRFRKFARRNKTAIATGIAIAIILLASTVFSSAMAVRAFRAQRIAATNEIEATSAAQKERKAREAVQKQRTLAQENARKANREATKSKEVATFLKDMLKGVGPSVALGRDTEMLQEILEKTSNRMDRDLPGQSEVQAELRSTIGDVYKELEQYNEAETQYLSALKLYREVHGPVHSEVAETLLKLGEVQAGRSQFDEASESMAASLQMKRTLLGDGHADLAEATVALSMLKSRGDLRDDYDEAKRLLTEALASYEKSPGDVGLGIARVLRALIQLDTFNQNLLTEREKAESTERTEPTLRRALDLVRRGEGNEYRLLEANLLHLLGAFFANHGDLERAEPFFRQVVEIKMSLPDGRLEALGDTRVLSRVQNEKANYAEAIATMRRVVREATDLFGAGSPKAVHYGEYLALYLYNQGHLSQAFNLMRQLASARATHGIPFRQAQQLHNLGFFLTLGYEDERHAREAESAIRKSWEIYKEIGGENSPRALSEGRTLCKLMCMLGDVDEAVKLRNEVALLEGDMWHTASTLNLISNNQPRNENLFEHLLETASDTENPVTAERAARAVLIDSHAAAAHMSQAITLAERSLELAKDPEKDHWQELCLGIAKYRQQRHDEAIALLDRALAAKERGVRPLALTFAAMSAIQQDNTDTARERIDALGIFSVLPNRFPRRFTFRADALAAQYLQSELRSQLPDPDLDSLSDEERIKLGLERHARHVSRHPQDVRAAEQLASLFAWYHKDDEHQQLCARLLERARSSESAGDQYQAAIRFLSHASVHESENRALIAQAKALAHKAEASVDVETLTDEKARPLAHYRLACALADLRLGHHLEADKWLKKAEPIVMLGHRGRWSALVAINESRLGNVDRAADALANAELLTRPAPSRDEVSLDAADDRGDDNDDMLISWLLLDEARSLVAKQTSKVEQPDKGEIHE